MSKRKILQKRRKRKSHLLESGLRALGKHNQTSWWVCSQHLVCLLVLFWRRIAYGLVCLDTGYVDEEDFKFPMLLPLCLPSALEIGPENLPYPRSSLPAEPYPQT